MATYLKTMDGETYLDVDCINEVSLDGDIAYVNMIDEGRYCHKVAAEDWLAYLETQK